MNPREAEMTKICDFISSVRLNKIFNALLISGFPGCGKTYTVNLAFQQLKLKPLYFNCVQQPELAILKQNTQFVIMDEIDIGLRKFDLKPFFSRLQQLKCGLIMICNELQTTPPVPCDNMYMQQFSQTQLKTLCLLKLNLTEATISTELSESLDYLCYQVSKNSDARLLDQYLSSKDLSIKYFASLFTTNLSINEYQAKLILLLDKYQQTTVEQLKKDLENELDNDFPQVLDWLKKLETTKILTLKGKLVEINQQTFKKHKKFITDLAEEAI
ncbi:Conserved_hypothetical protein [Hexamita inflata]|uniref:Uncharacterized protein n=1 Tax=Hexamita inflata TaxID=28002 RepID=A0AA86R2I9_9EUKA|nr:Conserved hypothetical protein [Hexamita inflata]